MLQCIHSLKLNIVPMCYNMYNHIGNSIVILVTINLIIISFKIIKFSKIYWTLRVVSIFRVGMSMSDYII